MSAPDHEHVPESQPPTGGAPDSRRFGPRALAGAAVAALVVGLGAGVAIGGPLLGGGSDDVSAEGDLRTACRYAEEIGSVADGDITPDGPLLWRLQAVMSLTVASGVAGDDDGLESAGARVMTATQRFDLEELNDALDELRTNCD